MRDNYHAIRNQDVEVFGLSTQPTDYQTEAATRLHLPFALLSDENLRFTHALRLPTFQVNGWTLTNRLTLVLHHQKIEKVFYPVPSGQAW
jgi:peroxiredoxin